MNERVKFKGKIKLRLPLKVRRLIHEIKIAARFASSRAKRKQQNSPHSYIHPNIYPEIDPDIEPIISTAITQPVPPRDHRDRLTARTPEQTDHPTCPPDRAAATPAATGILSPDGLAALLLGVLLFISPLYSYVFSREPLPAYMLAAVAFAVHACHKIRKGKLDLFGSRLNTALFILPLLAFFSIITAWDTRGAVGLFLLLSSCFATCWLTSSLTAFPAAAQGLILVIIAGGATASILMLTPIAQGSIAGETLYSAGALLSASYLCCICIMSYQPHFTTNLTDSTTSPDSDYLTPITISSTTGLNANNQTPLTTTPTTGLNSNSKIPRKTLITLINPTLFAAGYFLLMSITSLSSVLTYTAILLGIALLLYGLTPAMRKNALGIILIQGASVFLVIRPVQESLAAAGRAGWLWAGAGLLLSVAMLNTWHRLKKYAEPGTGKGPPTGKDPRTGKAPGPSKALPAAGYRKAPQGKPHRRGSRRLRPWVIPTAAVFLSLLILISSSQNIPLLSKQAAGQQPYPLTELMLRSRDALKAMATSPGTLLLGSGGGGWPALSHMHQSFYYEAPVPGAFLQAGVELGVFGLLAFCAAWSIFINKMKQLLKTNRLSAHSITHSITGSSVEFSSEQKAVITAAAAGGLALGCHFILWCGFSPAASLYLFAFFGLGNSLSSRLLPQPHIKRAKTLLIHRPKLQLARLRLPKLQLPRPRLPKVIITGIYLPKITLSKAFSKISIGTRLPKISLPKHRLRIRLIGLSVSSAPKGSANHNKDKTRLYGERASSGSKGSAYRTSLRSLLYLPLAWAKAAAANSNGLAANTARYLAALAAAALIFTLSWGILMGERSARTAAHALQKGDLMAALHNMEKAAQLDPFNSSYHKQLGMLYLERGPVNALPKNRLSNGDAGQSLPGVFPEALHGEGKRGSDEGEKLKKAVFHFQKGLRLSRGDVELRVLYAEALLQMGEVEEGAAQLKEAVKLRPLQQNLYEYLALGCLTAGRFLLEQAQTPEKAPQENPDKAQQKAITITLDKTQPANPEKDPQATLTISLDKNLKESQNEPTARTYQKNLETSSQQTQKISPTNTALLTKARSYLKAALRVPEEMEKRRAHINKNHLIYWRGSPYLGNTPKIQLYSGEAAALLGNWPQAVHYLSEAARDASLKPEALLWQGLVLKRTGRGQEGETLINRALQEKPELSAELNKLEELLE